MEGENSNDSEKKKVSLRGRKNCNPADRGMGGHLLPKGKPNFSKLPGGGKRIQKRRSIDKKVRWEKEGKGEVNKQKKT